MREGAAETLGRMMSLEATDALASVLSDSDRNVRKSAAEALARIYSPGNVESERIVGLLLTALCEEDWYVRRWTAAALRNVKTPSVTNSLINRVTDHSEHMVVRGTSARSLGYHGSPEAVPALVALMNLPDYRGYENVRSRAAVALGQIALELKQRNESENRHVISQIVDEIIASLPKGDGTHRWNAIEALAPLKDPKVVPSLIRYLSDEHRNCREICAFALGETGDPVAVPHLISALEDEYWVVQRNSAEALGKIADREAIRPLEMFISQCENERCKMAATAALERIRNGDI
jgi:HEAT repeat protein